jgi:hypothetical protein
LLKILLKKSVNFFSSHVTGSESEKHYITDFWFDNQKRALKGAPYSTLESRLDEVEEMPW